MTILNKTQFAETPIGTVFCTFEPDILSEKIYVKSDYRTYNGKPTFDGVIPLCPYFETQEYEDDYDGKPDPNRPYFTECFSTDTALHDFDDDTLFAVFSRAEVRRMIDVLTFALSGCEGKCITDEDCYIVQ